MSASSNISIDSMRTVLMKQSVPFAFAQLLRLRVSFFMNRFRKLGFIQYNGRIRVHKSLLNVILHDQLPGNNAGTPPVSNKPPSRSATSRKTGEGSNFLRLPQIG